MIKQLAMAIKKVLASFSPKCSALEAMMKIDFKIDEERINLIQLCFSNLAAWPFFVIAGIIQLNFLPVTWSLQHIFSDHLEFRFFLIDGRMSNMLLFFALFFVFEWIVRNEYLLLSFILYFLLKSDFHFHLAVASSSAVLFSRCCYLWWFHLDLKSRSFKIWKVYSSLQLIGTLMGIFLCLYLLQVLFELGYFSSSGSENRFQALILFVLILYLSPLPLTTVWGHFFVRKKKEPTDFPIHYSTAGWILRFRMRPVLRKQLLDQIHKYREVHQKNLHDFQELKDLGPVSIPSQIIQILKTELGYLDLASSRLTIL